MLGLNRNCSVVQWLSVCIVTGRLCVQIPAGLYLRLFKNGRLSYLVRHCTFKGKKVDCNAPFQNKVAGESYDQDHVIRTSVMVDFNALGGSVVKYLPRDREVMGSNLAGLFFTFF
jgi:hypothetical protein